MELDASLPRTINSDGSLSQAQVRHNALIA